MLDGRLRATVSRGLTPIGRGLERAGVGPDGLTALGLALSVLTALLIASGHLIWAVVGLTASQVPPPGVVTTVSLAPSWA